ncbi:ATP-binding protein [Pantoea sp. Taur]|uniref:ATP-binding protein n=1 Tax=Pantoea sp. Taur TaxID=2576757 RepID=UPI0013553808|nr:ATP-binding protein [Pantoea sp. Taur]MXP58521.1 response regulator [Pantoea sp. Taur]
MHILVTTLLIMLVLPTALAQTLMLTPDEQRWIKDHPEVPYSFIASWPLDYKESEKHIGLSREYLDKISEISGLKFILSHRDGPRAQLITALAPELLTSIQSTGWSFSHRWLSTTALIVAHNSSGIIQSLEQLKGKRVAVRSGTYFEHWLQEKFPDITLVPMPHTREVFEAVYNDAADVGLGPDLVMRPLLYRYFSDKLTIAGQIPEMMAGLSMAITDAEPQLLNIVNKALAAIPAEEANKIYDRWASDMKLGYPSIGVILSLYQLEIGIFALLLLLLAFLLPRAVYLRRKATASEARKTQFLAMMSHEIRTPMNAMIAALELLKRPVNSEQREQYLALANSSASSLLALLNDILEHSQLSSRRVNIVQAPLAPDTLISTVCESYRPMAEQKGLRLLVSIDDRIRGIWMLGDANRLRQITNNLLSNAIKFTETGVVSLTLDGEIKGNNSCLMTLEVSDTGIGIAKDQQHNLFAAWSQVDHAADRRYSGSGLGLWISYQLVTLMRGTLRCHSRLGEGSIFTLQLEMKKCDAVKQVLEPDLPRFTSDTSILLVEDHPAAQRMVRAQLETLGCQVEVAINGQQALWLVEEENYYDAILLDINLPDISGYEVARQIRILEKARDVEKIPIIAISAMSDDTHYQQCEESQIDEVLSKPIVLPTLAKSLRRWCHLASPVVIKAPTIQLVTNYTELQRCLEEDLAGFYTASESQNRQLLRYYAHRLRGAAQMYQRSTLARLATHIESELRSESELTRELSRGWFESLKSAVTSAIHP